MHGLEFVALYTLQHGLPSNAEDARGIQHRHIAFRGLLDEARSKFLVNTDTPWGSWSDLLAVNETVVEPSVQGGWREIEDLSCFLDC